MPPVPVIRRLPAVVLNDGLHPERAGDAALLLHDVVRNRLKIGVPAGVERLKGGIRHEHRRKPLLIVGDDFPDRLRPENRPAIQTQSHLELAAAPVVAGAEQRNFHLQGTFTPGGAAAENPRFAFRVREGKRHPVPSSGPVQRDDRHIEDAAGFKLGTQEGGNPVRLRRPAVEDAGVWNAETDRAFRNDSASFPPTADAQQDLVGIGFRSATDAPVVFFACDFQIFQFHDSSLFPLKYYRGSIRID